MPFDPLVPVVTLPTEFDTSRPVFAGTKRTFTDGATLRSQEALAVDGDQIVVAPGSTVTIAGTKFTGTNRGTSGWVEIRTDISDAALDAVCPEGVRMTPTKAAALNLATINVNMPNDNGFTFADGASGFRFTALRVQVDPAMAHSAMGGGTSSGMSELFRTGNFNKTVDAQETSRIIFDRMYLYGSQATDCKRAVFFCSSYSGIVDSHVEDFYFSGTGTGSGDSQALLFAGNRGPYQIINNYLDGYGETVMMGGVWNYVWKNGGANVTINAIASDLVFRYNVFTAKTSTMAAVIPQGRKNAFEIKSAYRVLCEYNLYENVINDGQNGAVWGLHANSDQQDRANLPNTDPSWIPSNHESLINGSSDVTMRYNWTRNAGGIKVFATADSTANEHFMDRVHIHDNLFELANDQGNVNFDGFCAQFSRPLNWWVFHNTWAKWTMSADHTGVSLFGAVGEANTLSMQSNIFHTNVYGMKGETAPGGYGSAALTSITDPTVGGTAAVDYNLWIGLDGTFQGRTYPSHDWNVTLDSGVGFTDLTGGGRGYALTAGSTYSATGTKPGHDGLDRGADIPTLMDGTDIATSGDRTAVAPGTADHLAATTQPSATTASGVVHATQPAGVVQDASDATVTDDTSTVTAAWVSETGSGTAIGTLTAVCVAGVWAFTNLGVTSTLGCTGHWTFTDGSLTSVDSATITILAAGVPVTSALPAVIDQWRPPATREGLKVIVSPSPLIGTGGLVAVASNTVSVHIPVGRIAVSVLSLALDAMVAAAGGGTVTVQVFKVTAAGVATALTAATSIKNDVVTAAGNLDLPMASSVFDGPANGSRRIDGTRGEFIRVDIVASSTITTQPQLRVVAELAVTG